jgi:hypothetical protein
MGEVGFEQLFCGSKLIWTVLIYSIGLNVAAMCNLSPADAKLHDIFLRTAAEPEEY